MKRSSKRKVAAKGDRLNWTPLEHVKPVKLTTSSAKGRVLTAADLKARNTDTRKTVLVP